MRSHRIWDVLEKFVHRVILTKPKDFQGKDSTFPYSHIVVMLYGLIDPHPQRLVSHLRSLKLHSPSGLSLHLAFDLVINIANVFDRAQKDSSEEWTRIEEAVEALFPNIETGGKKYDMTDLSDVDAR